MEIFLSLCSSDDALMEFRLCDADILLPGDYLLIKFGVKIKQHFGGAISKVVF